jgi:hypothetical protein
MNILIIFILLFYLLINIYLIKPNTIHLQNLKINYFNLILFILACVIFIIIIFIIIYFSKSTFWTCINNNCVISDSGKFKSKNECLNDISCKTIPSKIGWSCFDFNKNKCIQNGGPFESENKCKSDPICQIIDDKIIDFNYINQRFSSLEGILVVMSDYSLADKSQKIYLENNAFLSNDKSINIIAMTYLTNLLPLNIYATSYEDTTIGIILNAKMIYDANIIQCMQITDANSVNRACNTNGAGGNPGYPCTCLPGFDCNSKEHKEVQAGCGVYCWDKTKQCNTVNWCKPTYTDTEIINNYSSLKWNGVGENCLFKPPPNDLFVKSAIAWRKAQPSGPNKGNYWTETELDGVVDLNDNMKSLWLKSIIGIFHSSDPGYMCHTTEDPPSKCKCVNDDPNTSLACMKQNCSIDNCQTQSINTVKAMVNEYNTKISSISGHKIKGWSLKNINRHSWNGWGPENNYTVNLSKFLVELPTR